MMIKGRGHLRKMSVAIGDPAQYQLILDQVKMPLNHLIGEKLEFEYQGSIHCVQCGRKTSKSFQQGHCFPCMQRINECGNCILFPERCQVEQGTCPKDDWAHAQCHAEQIVYLANTSGLKVGITRSDNTPTRWLDQGAMQALPIFRASNRYQCGLIEVALKKHVADKTNWRTMLKQHSIPMNLIEHKERLLTIAKRELISILDKYQDEIHTIDAEPIQIQFPIKQYPEKLVSHNFDKCAKVEGRLQGIKGQYLILDTGVLNVRKFSGYDVSFVVR